MWDCRRKDGTRTITRGIIYLILTSEAAIKFWAPTNTSILYNLHILVAGFTIQCMCVWAQNVCLHDLEIGKPNPSELIHLSVVFMHLYMVEH